MIWGPEWPMTPETSGFWVSFCLLSCGLWLLHYLPQTLPIGLLCAINWFSFTASWQGPLPVSQSHSLDTARRQRPPPSIPHHWKASWKEGNWGREMQAFNLPASSQFLLPLIQFYSSWPQQAGVPELLSMDSTNYWGVNIEAFKSGEQTRDWDLTATEREESRRGRKANALVIRRFAEG